jgi:hypothetical protein
MVNAFKTDANGLPELNTFNDTSLLTQSDFLTNGIDPRLDHTCAIVGHPFKYQPERDLRLELGAGAADLRVP